MMNGHNQIVVADRIKSLTQVESDEDGPARRLRLVGPMSWNAWVGSRAGVSSEGGRPRFWAGSALPGFSLPRILVKLGGRKTPCWEAFQA